LSKYIIVDGSHRLEKSARLGHKYIYARFISEKLLKSISK